MIPSPEERAKALVTDRSNTWWCEIDAGDNRLVISEVAAAIREAVEAETAACACILRREMEHCRDRRDRDVHDPSFIQWAFALSRLEHPYNAIHARMKKP